MYTEDDLQSAVHAGIMSQDVANAFHAHAASMGDVPPVIAVDEENFRLINSFNDIFVVLLCLLMIIAAMMLGRLVSPWVGAVCAIAVTWPLTEIFVRKRRMALPAIVLTFAFVGGVAETVMKIPVHVTFAEFVVAAGIVSALAAWAFLWRFRVPIAIATIAGSLTASGMAVVYLVAPDGQAVTWTLLAIFLAGAIILGIAIRWDISDRVRCTRRSDTAFWLHILSAPMLAYPLFTTIGDNVINPVLQGVLMIGLYGIFALLSLAMDRRALLVSALGYLLGYFTAIVHAGKGGVNFAIIALILGFALVLLAILWHSARNAVLRIMPGKIRSTLPVSS